jgi:hypothetical protein
MKRIGLVVLALLMASLTMTGTAWAKKPKTEGLSQEEIKTLKSILPHIKYVESGVGGKPTIQFSGVNVQVVSGAGSTNAAVNGEGNLAIGYDENKEGKQQTGSHDLILGEEQTFTSYGGILAGRFNTISAPFASVTGGYGNTASEFAASVSGGGGNTASAFASSVSGGGFNRASGGEASVSGGQANTAKGLDASVSGGKENLASGFIGSSVSGGFKNTASGGLASVFGGKELKAALEYEACGGNPTVFC